MSTQTQTTENRHGVEVGSWWLYSPEAGPGVVLRVCEWSYYGNDRGGLELDPYPQLYWHRMGDDMNERIKATLHEIDRIDVVKFWELVDAGAIVSLSNPADDA